MLLALFLYRLAFLPLKLLYRLYRVAQQLAHFLYALTLNFSVL